MPTDLLKSEIDTAGLSRAFEVLDLDDFVEAIKQADALDSLTNRCFHRFLDAIILPNIIPATWQKLADLQWSDDEIGDLVDAGLIKEAPTTLIAAINLGALAKQEYDEFVNYPNQEVQIFYFTKSTYQIMTWLQGKVTLPRLNKDAFAD